MVQLAVAVLFVVGTGRAYGQPGNPDWEFLQQLNRQGSAARQAKAAQDQAKAAEQQAEAMSQLTVVVAGLGVIAIIVAVSAVRKRARGENGPPCPTCGERLNGRPSQCPQCATRFVWSNAGKTCEYWAPESGVGAPKKGAEASAVKNPNLLPCPDCGNQVSKLAKACPKCGRPLAS